MEREKEYLDMKYKKMKKQYLKRRILLNIFIVLVVSLLISTLISYFYFAKIVRSQSISDEKMKLNQLANQLNFMAEDINSFARSIVVDDIIQKLGREKGFETEYERIKQKDIIRRKLTYYNSLRTYIGSSFIELENGEYFSSNSGNVTNEEYLEEKFTQGELQEYSEQEGWLYSNAYYSSDSGNGQQVVCKATHMLNKYEFGERQGTLYMEIYMEYFLKQIRDYESNYGNIALIGNDNILLYDNNLPEGIKDFINEEKISDTGVYKVQGGYLIYEEIENARWRICTLIEDKYLWERSNFVMGFFLLSLVISLTLILLITSRLLEKITRPIVRLSNQMKGMDYYNLRAEKSIQAVDEIQTLYECYEKMLQEIRQGIKTQMIHEKQKKDMEFDIVLSQINPHYLYNVLNTVVYLTKAKENESAISVVNALIHTLQETMKSGEDNVNCTIQEELKFTQSYIKIQEYRYPNTFWINIKCEEELKKCIVPKTIIQPIVENAIFHGILPANKAGIIDVTIKKKNENLHIEITDNGVGIIENQMKSFTEGEEIISEEKGRRHIGLSNIRERIKYLCGPPYGIWIDRIEPQGTQVTIHLPVINNAHEYKK
jgi:Putative regulator of cell autolysis